MGRICMIAFAHYPRDGRVRREAEALVDRGDEVDVICIREAGEERNRLLNGVRLIQLRKLYYRGPNAVVYLAKYLLFCFAAFFWVTYLHLKNRYQIIQVHTMPDFLVFVAIIPKLLGAKVLLDVHDLMPELYQSKFGLPETRWLIRFITWVERQSIGFADRAIAVHKLHLDTLVKHGNPPKKFTILLNVPDPKIFSVKNEVSSRDDYGFRLLYHGTVTRRYGLSVALYAVSLLRKEISGLEFQIVGNGEDRSRLIDLVKQLDLTDCVSFSRSFVPVEQLSSIILNADVGVVPILYDDFTKLQLPVKLLEYVGLGLPVICSRTETIEAYFDDTMVQYVEAGNVDDLAQRILELYRAPHKRKRLATNAARFNHDYNWKQQKQEYYNLIDKLAGNGHVSSKAWGRVENQRIPVVLPEKIANEQDERAG